MIELERRTARRGTYTRLAKADGKETHAGIGNAGHKVRIDLGVHADLHDDGYRYSLLLGHAELLRCLRAIRSGDIAARLTHEEWAAWMRLSRKALGAESTEEMNHA